MTAPLPATAAFRHVGVREGFEVVFVEPRDGGGAWIEGHAVAVEGDDAWAVRFAIEVDAASRTRRAEVTARDRRIVLVADGAGAWWLDGAPAPQLAGCLDVDLEASAFTNALAVRRLGLAIGDAADAPAAYVRAATLQVGRLEQRYRRLDAARLAYAAPAFGADLALTFDDRGVVVDYPGLAVRAR